MDYLGVMAEHAKHDVPREDSTGDRVKRGGITKAGNSRARTALVEASWSYRHPPRVGREKLAKVEAAPEASWRSHASHGRAPSPGRRRPG